MSTIKDEEAHYLITQELIATGLSERHASEISHCLVDTSLRGVDTHGLRLLTYYLRELREGAANPSPKFKEINSSPVSCVFDCDNTNGILAGIYSMRTCIKKAQQSGMAIVVSKNSNHFGASSIFTRMASDKGLIGMAMTNSDALVAFHGGVKPFMGTNPIALSVEGNEGERFDLDMATSQTSISKVKAYTESGTPIPKGWGVDKNGTDNPNGDEVVALQPLGGYKGQGLGMMVQLLTCILAGMPIDEELDYLYREPYDKPRKISHFFMVINPELFIDADSFGEGVSGLLKAARNNTPEVILPGATEDVTYVKRKKYGIPLSDVEAKLVSSLRKKWRDKYTNDHQSELPTTLSD